MSVPASSAATGGVVAVPCDGSVSVSFPDPGSGGYTWQVTRRPDGATEIFGNSVPGFTWFGLTNGQQYWFEVTQFGTGRFIGESDPVTPRPGPCGEPENDPPVVSAGPDVTALDVRSAAVLNGTVTDDGRPEPPALTYAWRQISGPGFASIANPAAVDTTATFTGPGTYVLELSASDGQLTSSDTVTVTVPRDTVVVVLGGIGRLASDTTNTRPYQDLGAGDAFGPLLQQLGCPVLPFAPNAPTAPCTARRLFWSPFSYRGLTAAGAPAAYSVNDTFRSLQTLAAVLRAQVAAIRDRHPRANVVVVGYSEGGTVAARWASEDGETAVPIVTLDSPLYGMWGEDRTTPTANEDVDQFCPDSSALADPLAWSPFELYAVCIAWRVSDGGFRSQVSYDWRAGRQFAATPPSSLLLLNVGNRRDVIAPVWWAVSSAADAIRLTQCTGGPLNHGCVLGTGGGNLVVLQAIRDVAAAAQAAGLLGLPVVPSAAIAAFGTPPPPAQLAGYQIALDGGGGRPVVAVMTRGLGDGPTVRELTCLFRPSSPQRNVTLTSATWRPHSLVVLRRVGASVRASEVRVIPANDALTFKAAVGDQTRTPSPAELAGCP